LSNLYDLTPVSEGYQFTNNSGDQYYVYLTAYSLLDPLLQGEEAYVNVYMLGFNCKRAKPEDPFGYDANTKHTIISIFKSLLDQFNEEAFLYICDNKDGRARNRRITFGRWFNEANDGYEHHHSHFKYGSEDWYSAIIVKKDKPDKQFYIDAYHFTLAQILNGYDE